MTRYAKNDFLKLLVIVYRGEKIIISTKQYSTDYI